MNQTWTLERFRRSGKSHLASAQYLLENAVNGGVLEIRAVSPAYLAHVALECVIKARLLFRGNVASAEELKRKHPKVHEQLFTGAKGHDLAMLAKYVDLPAITQNEGKPWKDDQCWRRMASRHRPYALRYGAEDASAVHVTQEIARAEEIAKATLAGTRSVPLAGAQRRRK